MDLERLIEQVKLNCNISDAKFWGYYSICGLLMRFRELYRHEESAAPWKGIPQELISEWIASREAQWKDLEDKELLPLEIDGKIYDPFEVDGVNRILFLFHWLLVRAKISANGLQRLVILCYKHEGEES